MEDGEIERRRGRARLLLILHSLSLSLSFHPNGRCIGLAARAHSLSPQETGIGSAIFVAKIELFVRSSLGGILLHCTHLTDAG